jgi:excisionase family DNA binding protein
MATALLPSPLLNEKEAAEFLHVSAGTLSVVRCTRRWPLPYIRVGRAIRYRLSDLEAYLESRTVCPSSAE